MRKETKKAPTIRFRGFTDDWEQRKLSKVVSVCSGMDYKHLSTGNIPVYGTGGYMLSVNKALSYDRDAIGIGRKGTIDKPYILRAPFWTVDTLFYAIPQNEECIDFVYDLFQNVDWKKKDESTGVPSLSKVAINNTNVIIPSEAEQRKIGSFTSQLDILLTLHQRKLDQLKKLKKYFLQNMFPTKGEKVPRIRFKGFTGDWKQRKFGEIAEYKKGPFGSALKKDFFIPDSATSVKVYEQQNAINKNWNLSRYYISKEYAQKLKSFEVHAGDIIVSCAGTIGEIYELPAQSRSGIINQALMRIRVDEETVCKDIFKLAFSNMIDSFSREFSNGSAIKNIPPFADLKPMKVLLPNKDEQKIIGDFFTDIDKTITLHQRKLNQLQTMKKFMLQNLFI